MDGTLDPSSGDRVQFARAARRELEILAAGGERGRV